MFACYSNKAYHAALYPRQNIVAIEISISLIMANIKHNYDLAYCNDDLHYNIHNISHNYNMD